MHRLRELQTIKNVILSRIGSLGRVAFDYIFSKLENQQKVERLSEISFQYYLVLQDKTFVNRVYTRFNDDIVTDLFSINLVDSNDFYKISYEIKPKYSVFDSRSILALAEFIQKFVNFKKSFIDFAKDREDLKEIRNFINSTSNFKDLLNTIFYFIDRRGNIKDDATPELKKIRQEIYSLTKYIPAKLGEFIRQHSRYLISHEVSYRNGRFVVLLNSQYVSNFEGIVQDYSWTHRTAFFEPEFIINLNNRLTVLQSLENIEVQKVINHIFSSIIEKMDELSLVFKVCSFLEFFNCYFTISPYFCKPECTSRSLEIVGLINPLIKNCVPIDISFEDALMIVGPNNGGKSVALKSLALCILFSNVGLPVFAKFANIPFLRVFYDVPDPQDISQGISTFYGHVKYWRSILDVVDENSIVIMDEPASGTDPKEAAPITIAIVEYFISKRSKVVFTTHYSEVKNYFYGKIKVASVSFDFINNKSDYRLIYDIMLPSLPLNLLHEFPENIRNRISRIKEIISTSENEKIQQIFENVFKIEQEIREKEKLIKEKLEEIEKLKQKIREKVRNEVIQKLYINYSKQIELLIQGWEKELEKLKNKQDIQKMERKVKAIKNFDLNDYMYSMEEFEDKISVGLNDFVKINIFDEIGKIVQIKGDKVTVDVNGKKYTVSINEIKKITI
ncbi:MAG: hypothetical protein RMJ51_02650 [Candidatus Calescibacterium sp.]|nr:hypothetical protein [Candidatus Calescibacterium sp.]MCX7972271.1 hypothetical protein [bacterium]MDW8195127.1 hypothetical protein [Candidatus Calescibacterium sp.]